MGCSKKKMKASPKMGFSYLFLLRYSKSATFLLKYIHPYKFGKNKLAQTKAKKAENICSATVSDIMRQMVDREKKIKPIQTYCKTKYLKKKLRERLYEARSTSWGMR